MWQSGGLKLNGMGWTEMERVEQKGKGCIKMERGYKIEKGGQGEN